MKRIEDRKEKIKKIWMSVILAGIMVFSGFAIMVGNSQQSLKYNNFKFVQGNDQRIYTEVSEGKMVGFRYFPSDLQNISVPSEAVKLLNDSQVITVTFNSSYDKEWVLGYFETIEFELAQDLNDKIFVKGVTEQSEAYAAFPIMDCSSATAQKPVVYFEIVKNQTNITVENNCIIFKSDEYGFYALKDRLLFSYFGVMDG